ncbi:MAG: hypothetical protein J5669_02465 [Bacteroidales bacterium]|nr:hypothetical protein [Bacteroidales bacterium]
MKRLFFSIFLAVIAIGAAAQSGAVAEVGKEYKLAEFLINPSRMEAGLTIGQVGSFTEFARFGMGANILYNGFYLDFIEADPQHKYNNEISDTDWNDTCAFAINIGYQIPILSWLRIMPLVGYAQTNEGITNGSSLNLSADSDSISWYHDYKVTPGSRTHYFNYGGGISVQPCRWFSINLIGTRCALYGGFGLNLLEFARR